MRSWRTSNPSWRCAAADLPPEIHPPRPIRCIVHPVPQPPIPRPALTRPRAAREPPHPQDIVMAPPPGSEHLGQALDDFLRSRKAPNSRRILHRLLGILHPNNLRAAAHELRYNKPQWSDDNTTPAQYRAHWRVQASKIVGCKEGRLPGTRDQRAARILMARVSGHATRANTSRGS